MNFLSRHPRRVVALQRPGVVVRAVRQLRRTQRRRGCRHVDGGEVVAKRLYGGNHGVAQRVLRRLHQLRLCRLIDLGRELLERRI